MSKEKWYPEEEFFLKKINLDRVFSLLDKSDYMLLYYIRHMEERKERADGVYLMELAEEMGLSIPDMSKLAQRLQDRGFVYWNTDVSKGRTYVKLTENAMKQMQSQKEKLTEYYEQMMREIPEEDLKTTISTIYKISKMMIGEHEKIS